MKELFPNQDISIWLPQFALMAGIPIFLGWAYMLWRLYSIRKKRQETQGGPFKSGEATNPTTPQKKARAKPISLGPLEKVIVMARPWALSFLVPQKVMLDNFDRRARRLPEVNRWQDVGLVALGMLLGFVVGSMAGMIIPSTFPTMVLPVKGSLAILMFAGIGAVLFAPLGLLWGKVANKGFPLWVLRRDSVGLTPILDNTLKVERFKGRIHYQKSGEEVRLVVPSGIPPQSSSFMWSACRSKDLIDMFRSPMSKWQKITLGAVCVLAGAALMILMFYVIATSSPQGGGISYGS